MNCQYKMVQNKTTSGIISILYMQLLYYNFRNVLVESARIARGAVKSLAELDSQQFDAVIIPGGFGAAKNL